MANYCSNVIVFYGRLKKDLEIIMRNINSCLENPEKNSVRNFLKISGCDNDMIIEMADLRDYFTDCDLKVSRNKECGWYFHCATESAWTPNMECFKKLLKDVYGEKVKMVFQSEEPGCGIFVNSDKQSLFFTERFIVHGYYKGDYTTKYFDRWNDAVKFLQDWFPKARINCFNGIMEAKRKIEKAYRFNDKKPDYVCIDYFENDDEEEGGLAA